jgi:hypothetical protein
VKTTKAQRELFLRDEGDFDVDTFAGEICSDIERLLGLLRERSNDEYTCLCSRLLGFLDECWYCRVRKALEGQ